MAVRLGDLLTDKGTITHEQLDQALQAQRQLGGRLGTNLVEMGFVTEDLLARVLSEQLEVPFVDDSQVANIPADIIAQFPRELAEKYHAVPFLITGRVFCVCMADPADLSQVDQLRRDLDTAVNPYVVTEVALNYALERYYSIPRERRLLSLSGAPAASSSFVRMALSAGELADDTPPLPDQPPYDLDLGSALADVRDVTDLLRTMRQFVGSFWQRGVLLGLRSGEITGLLDIRLDVPPAALWRLKVELSEEDGLGQLIDQAQPRHVSAVDGALGAICVQLGIPSEDLSFLPIFENRRVVAVVVAQGANDDRVLPAARRFLAQVSCALQILTLRREIVAQH